MGSNSGECILMHCLSDVVEEASSDDGSIRSTFDRLDFYFVDLKKRNAYSGALPSLIDFLGNTTYQKFVVADRRVYLLGGLHPWYDSLPIMKVFADSNPSSFYTGASRFSLGLGDAENVVESSISLETPWEQMSKVHDSWYPLCSSINGHLYNFGRFELYPEVFFPSENRWEPLCNVPGEFGGRVFSDPLVSDQRVNRILLYFPGPSDSKASDSEASETEASETEPCLYGFYPQTDDPRLGEWVCLSRSEFPMWSRVGPVVDDVIFFHCTAEELIQPYDLKSDKWLNVQWSTPHLVDTTYMREAGLEFDALLLLADGLFCLAFVSSVFEGYLSFPPGLSPRTARTDVVFFKFSAERRGGIFVLTPVDENLTLELPRTRKVCTFAPLH